MRNWKIAISSCLFLLILCAPVIVNAEDEQEITIDRLEEIFFYISQYHIEGLSKEELIDAAIDGMIDALDDPFTEYLSADDFGQFTDSINHHYVGIGVRILEKTDGLYVEEVFIGSPAAESGLKPSDRFVTVEGQSTNTWSVEQLASNVKGPEGSTVEVIVERDEKLLSFTLERRAMQIPSVDAKWLGEGLGYIRYETFSEQAEAFFATELERFKKRGLERLIIDLRSNTGGYLNVASEMVSHFIEGGTLLYMQDSTGAIQPHKFENGQDFDLPLVILVDSFSASASELFTGALQDYGKATVIGLQTFGKGSVQQLIPLTDGSYLRLTVQRYLTPGKHHVDGVGITPDIEVYGQTAQLITAANYLGLNELEIVVDDTEWMLNSVAFHTPFPYVIDEGKVFVPSRILAGLTQADIEWNAGEKQVEFTWASGQSASFSVSESNDVRLEQGEAMIDLDRYQDFYPSLAYDVNDHRLTLQIKR